MNYFALIALLLLAPLGASAQNGYQLLEPLPGLSSGAGVSFAQLLSVFFTAALSLSAAAAVVMITLGGVQYMFSDAVGAKSAGRERIKNAVYGLILVFASWLIIYTISPNLLLFNLNIGNTGTAKRSACPNWICQTTRVVDTVPESSTKPGGVCDPASFGGVLPVHCADANWKEISRVEFRTGMNRPEYDRFRLDCATKGGLVQNVSMGNNLAFICKGRLQ